MQGNNFIFEQTLVALGWSFGVIGVLLVGLCTVIYGIMRSIRKRVEDTADKVHELMGTCKANHGGK